MTLTAFNQQVMFAAVQDEFNTVNYTLLNFKRTQMHCHNFITINAVYALKLPY